MTQATTAFSLAAVLLIVFSSCSRQKSQFELLSPADTHVDFNNLITESDSLNVLLFEYIYNGAGVGVGDFNNDGLTDIFFAGNMVSSRLYLNRGNFVFEDVTLPAGVQTSLWCTGVSLIDINQDNMLDIYISTVNPKSNGKSPNLLFINKGLDQKGIPTFIEVASKAGLDDQGYSTQAAFLDYDLDGDLDMYLLNNAIENYTRNTPIGQRTDGRGKSVDKLFRCDSITHEGIPIFTDVSMEAGILPEGWGLGVIVNDINNDGYPDVYASNDFLSNDHLFINNRNGTFTNEIGRYLRHQEFNGMGADMADINNDGLNDIIAVDMLPEDNLRKKTMFSNIGYDRFQKNLQMHYQPQYVRNVLQLNNGNGSFSDIGYMAGISETDWSWSALMADFDNDGFRDVLITNGYRKDVTDMDFVAYSHESSMFGTDEIRLKKAIDAVNALEGVKKPNLLFRNNGNLTFTNEAGAMGLGQPSYSNGAAYADFDNDGDLDLVMNNLNENAFLYRNNLNTTKKGPANYLRIKLKGNRGNSAGLGTKIYLYHQGTIHYAEHQLQRGYKSTVESIEHFGLGNVEKIDSIVIDWPGGDRQVIRNVEVNQVMLITQKDTTASKAGTLRLKHKDETIFHEAHGKYDVRLIQPEEDYVDYKQGQRLLLQKYSQLGPGIATGDINGDGLDDFVVGGVAHHHATIFYQQPSGVFQSDSLPDKDPEDMGILLFDADGDSDLDLYCVSGSSEFNKDGKFYQDRFYRNNGLGKFLLDTMALPRIESSGSCVTASDFDKDGDLDLFVGGRISPLEYPTPPESYLLRNNGKGVFENITPPSLQRVGMVTAALWTDFDNDQWVDLMLVGEWMPITFFRNNNGTLESFVPRQPDPETTVGWWNSLNSGDFDNDGDIDYVAGNLGLNSPYKASMQEPVCVYAKDFDHNGSIDPVLCRYILGKEYISHPRETLTEQLPTLKKMLTSYAIYGKSTFRDIFSKENLEGALIYKGTLFSSSFIENTGNGNFKVSALPVEAQTAPMFGTSVSDINNDGKLDLMSVSNSYSTETLTGYYDAGIGSVLMGDGRGNFAPMEVTKSGFFVDTDAKALASLNIHENESLFIVTSNQDSVSVFETARDGLSERLRLLNDEVYAVVEYADGRKQKFEFYYGSGYLSQTSRVLNIPKCAASVTIHSYEGNTRKYGPVENPCQQ